MPKLQHIRSATPDKRPDPALLVDGQLAINTAAATPAVYTKDDAGGLIKIGPTFVGLAAPNSSPSGSAGNSVGEHWMDTSVAPPVLRVWDGASWIASEGLAGPQGPAGVDGAAGPAGNDGAAGPQGPAGNDGAAGTAGIDGAAGPQGEVGPAGPAGADSTVAGPAGADGAPGAPGAPGADSTVAGPAGADGAPGAAGVDGAAGADGAAGPQGPAGPNAVSADAGNVITIGTDGLVYTSKSALQSIVGVTGSIAWVAGNAVPDGYLAADGGSYSSASYPELYAVIALTYGGDGNVFSVPDLRGMFIRGFDNGRGTDAGRLFGSSQQDAIKASSIFGASKIYYQTPTAAGEFSWGGGYGELNSVTAMGEYSSQINLGTGLDTHPMNIAMLPCIKY